MFLLLLAPAAQALQWNLTNPFPDGPLAGVARGITLSGELLPGDSAKFVQWMRSRPADAWHAMGRVELKISGGETKEALRLADTLVGLYPHMATGADCAGACAIVWLSGAWRVVPKGKIGLDTPRVQTPAIRAGAAPDAPPPYDPLPDQLRNYLVKQGVPTLLVEQVLSASANSVYWLTDKDINSTGVWPPYYFEKLRTSCPLLLHNEESFHTLRRCAARLVVSQKAFAFDKLLDGATDPWWNDNRALLKSAPR